MADVKPIRFIGQPIEVQFDELPVLEKVPDCPDRFVWGETTYRVQELLANWHDYRRKGRMSQNMQEEHSSLAAARGSWGVGRDYFRVRTHSDRIFELYYDRAPKKSRKGEWFLYREVEVEPRDG